jgi:hypothetical protein
VPPGTRRKDGGSTDDRPRRLRAQHAYRRPTGRAADQRRRDATDRRERDATDRQERDTTDRHRGRSSVTARDPGERLRAVALATVVVVSVLVAPIGLVGTAAAANTVSSCAVITQPGVYELDSNVTTTSSTCFEITADDVVLDGNGHVVNGVNGSGTAVALSGTGGDVRSNVTVRNVTLVNWNRSVYADHASDTTLAALTVINGSSPTVVVENASDSVTLTDVTVADTSTGGYDATTWINRSATATPTVTLTNLTVLNSSYDGAHVVAERVVVRNLVVDGVDGAGLEVFNTGEPPHGNVTVRDAWVNDTGLQGLSVDTGGNVTVANVTAANTGDDGVEAAGGASVQVTNASTRATGASGLDLSADGSVTVEGSAARNASDWGMKLSTVNGSITVRNALLNDSQFQGIDATAGGNVTLANVGFQEGEAADLLAREGGIVVRNVTVRGMMVPEVGYGIHATANRSVEVTGSHFRDVDGTALKPESTNGSVTVRDSTFAENLGYGYAIDGTANRTMTVANVSLRLTDGVYVSSDGDTVVRTVSAVDTTGIGIEAYASGNLTLVDSYVANVTDYGVLVQGTDRASIENVYVYGTNSYGVRASSASNVSMRDVSLVDSYYGVQATAWAGSVDVRRVRVHNVTTAGVSLDANGTATARDVAVSRTDSAGINVWTDRGMPATLTNASVANVSGVGVGVYTRTASLTNVTVADANGTDLAVPDGAASLDRVVLDGSRIDGTADNVTVGAVNASERPDPPSNKDDVGVYLNATNTTADGYLNVTVH